MQEIEGAGFNHLVIQRMGLESGSRLHVYIEGDGIPWTGDYPSADPTPRNTLALRLADLDHGDVAYIGRPCYFGYATTGGCRPRYWTSHRYGEDVLASMAAAIERARLPRHSEIVLIGHSGGGTLAALLESRIEGVVGVVTIAANLDIEQWARHHSYDPLAGSLNPVDQERIPGIPHLQLIGGSDETVPAYSVRDYARIQPNVEVVEIADFDHTCCWEARWPAILNEFAARRID